MKAKDIMTTGVISVTPTTPIADIATLLLERRISAVPVVEENGRIVGIVSEGDLLHRPETETERRRSRWLRLLVDRSIQAAEFAKSHGAYAQDVMSRNVVTVSPDTDVGEIARLLEERRIKRVPVVDNGKLVGIVSRANLLQGLVAFQKLATPPPREETVTTDAAIRERVSEMLDTESWIDADHLNIVVSNGIVHLWGMVRSDEQRRALRIAVQGIPGVLGVEDHLAPDWFTNMSG